MWPFNKKPNPPGFKKDYQGNVTLELTDEERQVVQEVFDTLKIQHPERKFYAEKDTVDGMTSMGLFNYAREQVRLAYSESNKSREKEFIEKAIASILKAYNFCPLPIYIYDLACFLEMSGKNDNAKKVLTDFLKSQESFKPTQLQKSLLDAQDRDMEEVLKNTKNKLGVA